MALKPEQVGRWFAAAVVGSIGVAAMAAAVWVVVRVLRSIGGC